MTFGKTLDLHRFLLDFPAQNNFFFKHSLEKDIRRALFLAASVNGRFVKEFVLDGASSEVRYPGHPSTFSPDNTNGGHEINPFHLDRPCLKKGKDGLVGYTCL